MDASCGRAALSVGTADSSHEFLDRCAAWEALIPLRQLQQALDDCGLVPERRCRLTPLVMLRVVLAMGLYTDVPLRGVFRHCRRFHFQNRTLTRSALCRARQRLGTKPLRALFHLIVAPQAPPQTPGAFDHRWRLVGVDGAQYTTPDTPRNEQAFGRPKGGSSSDSQGGFPQVGKVSLIELGTHIEFAFALRSQAAGEPTIASRLVPHLTPDMLVLLDAGFFGFPLLKSIHNQGAQFLVNTSSTPRLDPLRPLSDGSYLTKIHPSPGDRLRDRRGMWVRVLRYRLNDPQRAGYGEVHRLVTTLLDERQYPAAELIALYHERWEHELTYAEQKTHQDPRRVTKTTHLRSETPAGIVQELYALSLAHFTARRAMAHAADKTGLDPDRLSFTGALSIVRVRLGECHSSRSDVVEAWYQRLLAELHEEQLPPRVNRINPRVVKRARCKFPTKKPHHYRPPPLLRTFVETIVID